jgi:malate dehydrogenase
MREVAILGAGELGGALAHAIARLNLSRVIRLIDERGSVARGKALDISQAAPLEGFASQLSAASDWSYAAAADLVLVADRVAGGEWAPDEAVTVLRQAGTALRAPIICAGSNAAALVDRAALDARFPRARLIGSAPEALVSTARALAAIAVNGSARDIGIAVIGLPPEHTIVPWHDATFAGQSLTRLLDEPARHRLKQRIAAAWPPGPLALAAAAAKAAAAISGRSRQILSCFVAPDRAAGTRNRVAALPVRLGPGGIVEVVMPSLTAGEQVALDNAMLV